MLFKGQLYINAVTLSALVLPPCSVSYVGFIHRPIQLCVFTINAFH